MYPLCVSMVGGLIKALPCGKWTKSFGYIAMKSKSQGGEFLCSQLQVVASMPGIKW